MVSDDWKIVKVKESLYVKCWCPMQCVPQYVSCTNTAPPLRESALQCPGAERAETGKQGLVVGGHNPAGSFRWSVVEHKHNVKSLRMYSTMWSLHPYNIRSNQVAATLVCFGKGTNYKFVRAS